jgi:hypothetical protein
VEEDETAKKIKIGDEYGGGIVCHVDSTGKHGLICASYDQATAVTWNNGTNLVTNANGAGMGTGLANTAAIVAAQGSGEYAAKICYDLDLNGYSDWYLPSKSECFAMYFNLKIMKGIGHFTDALYLEFNRGKYRQCLFAICK